MATTEAKHTPGPWHSTGSVIEGGGEDSHGFIVAWGTDDRDSCVPESEAEANLSLIAAAPELLAALKAILAVTDRNHVAWDKARAAIAKAEGRHDDE